ncbi:carbohydrate ABC transporter permease [Tepidimonas sp. HKU77]|uniref:carbohydrate ABC transporter permease n=1 Tax=Tepidimonas sp. HKU77 TaxID=3414503 RepID=UPI003C7CCDE1
MMLSSRLTRAILFRALRHLLLMAGALVFLAPFIWMVLTSLKPVDEVFTRELSLLPTRLALVENYTEALTRVPLLRYLWNGLLVCAAILVLQIVVLLPAAYAFAKLQFRGKTWAWRLVLLALMIPHQATAIPTYVLLHHLGLLNTLSALIVPFSISAFGIFLMRQFFRTVPDDLVHAARLDGMGEFELVWRVMLPTAMPALFAFAIFSVVWHWNDYFWPLLVISSPELATPPLGIMFFRNEEAGINYGPLMAGTVLITAPLLLLFIAAQKRFIEGVTLTGVKG